MLNLALMIALLDVNAGAAAHAAKARPAPDMLVCRDLQELGSRIRYHRVCMTRAEWEQAEVKAKHELWKAERNAVMRPGQVMPSPIG